MGLAIQQEVFLPEDHERFARRLEESLAALRELLARPGFGEGAATIGAELELFLVDARGYPLPVNRQVLARTVDPRVTLEMDRFNLELNPRPGPLAGRPFRALQGELEDSLREVRRAARTQGARVAVVGILPTLREEDLGRGALTAQPRYRALSAAIRERRAAPFHVAISGEEESLALTWDDVTLEGANTSFQMHLRVAPRDFARLYNAAQLATAPVLAVSGNSPLLLGHKLWDETRVALFRQAVDDRVEPGEGGFCSPARVTFGHGWAREGAYELFAESVALHPPLLPVMGHESPLERVAEGGLPGLDELRLHQGTVWTWNRAIYDPRESGHLRIEMRALPAGPTVVDMVANGAFLLGLTLGLGERMDTLLPALPFAHASGNFLRAARRGLDAELSWPGESAPSPRLVPVVELVRRLLPVARRGLLVSGVEAEEVDRMLDIIARRVDTGRTGARWQRRVLARLEAEMPRRDALAAMLERYLQHAESGEPVHTWPED
ncbi:glutamate-cysteine ligase family protein [Myxococcus landrumensis]|uniref:Glutamate--cysteine ligase n=1 Tax=Myxococcus landrumensis TaxID=2813577 RepID=A0ABX7MZ06_9BACT|nr:glutamate-cysteine ligase family protein [Myxococcus landrumus]QSQ10705.1 glutamate--cysteine ligase [Myxococcus landrumus]